MKKIAYLRPRIFLPISTALKIAQKLVSIFPKIIGLKLKIKKEKNNVYIHVNIANTNMHCFIFLRKILYGGENKLRSRHN
jgi:hypothetical protein